MYGAILIIIICMFTALNLYSEKQFQRDIKEENEQQSKTVDSIN